MCLQGSGGNTQDWSYSARVATQKKGSERRPHEMSFVRRPDAHTRAQRLTKTDAASLLRMIRELNEGRDRDIRDVYLEEVRRGTHCKVLMP